MKKFIVREQQLAFLVETKKKRNKTLLSICEEIDKKIKFLNEGKELNDAITDTLKKYKRRGLLDDKILLSIKDIYSSKR